MKLSHTLKACLFIFLSCALTQAIGQLRLPALISDGMVLQRDAKVKVWGWASAGEKVTLRFLNKTYRTSAGPDGRWSIMLLPTPAGGPHTMQVEGKNRITISNILVGDVWLCSGQSNMVLPMERVKEKYADVIATADYPAIRHFFIPTVADLNTPHDDLPPGAWKQANPKDVLQFSATAFFFAREIYNRYKTPIGLINASAGGTPIEAWISEEGLQEFPALLQAAARYKDTSVVNTINRAAAEANRKFNPTKETDMGLNGPLPWYDTAYKPKGWKLMQVPGYWEDQGIKDLNGVVWYRGEILLPASFANAPAKLFMGRIVDSDEIYVNGVRVGNTTYQYPPRRYTVPAGLLKQGRNIITMRVINTNGKGGFVPGKQYYITANNDTLSLKGDWQYKVGQAFVNEAMKPSVQLQYQPTALYNAMIAPLTNYHLKGMLWYQGEANTGNAFLYRKLLPALIQDWRAKWNASGLPFLYVQLPGFMERQYLPSESGWAQLREAQSKALSVPGTGMAVAIDLGEWNDIHPLNKKDVGERLALLARRQVYGDTGIVASGPLYSSSRIDGNRIIISFTHTGGGLISSDGEPLYHFSIAGADKKFVWAQARIEGNKVIVWNDNIPDPLYVRYAWADNPEGANLSNKEGLPAGPFRTDE